MIQFRGERFYLSNMYPCKVKYKGFDFPSSEHAYLLDKMALIERIKCPQGLVHSCLEKNPVDLKKFSREYLADFKIEIDFRRAMNEEKWEPLEVMETVLRSKFSELNPTLVERLIKENPEEIVEHNEWFDTFWGVFDGKGENHLGKIIQKIRLDLIGGKE